MGDVESFGNSSTEYNEKAHEAISDLMQKLFPGCMVQKFLLVVEKIDMDDRKLCVYTAPGQKAWDTDGLISFIDKNH